MTLTRRHLLHTAAGAACAAAAPALFARAPLTGAQALSIHRTKLGTFEVTSILDGFIEADPRLLNAPPEMVQRLLEAAQLPYGPVRIPVNAFLVNTGEKLVLIDSGGARMLGPNAGRLQQGLAAAGVEPAQIDEVYVTHMHGDHLHGVVTPEGGPLFPNAVVRVSRPDVEYWTSPEVEAKAPDNQKGRFVAARRAKAAYGDRLKPFEMDAELTAGIRSIAAAGHTPGHSCYLVSSGNARMLAIGDLIHIAPVQLTRPEVTIAFDWEQGQARSSRQDIFEWAARDNLLIAAAHLPFPGVGHLRKEGASFAYEPLSWRLF